MKNDPVEKRAWIWAAARSTSGECLIWPWGLDGDGYGLVRWVGPQRSVHVISCTIAHGPRPDGLQAAHSCNVRSCANGRHLYWATPAQNYADRASNGTTNQGERNGRAKLTEYAVLWIRSLGQTGHYTQRELGEMFGVAQQTVSRIVNRKMWERPMMSDLTAPIDNLNAECVTQRLAIRRQVDQLRCEYSNWQPRDIPSKEEWDELPPRPAILIDRRRHTRRTS